MATNMLEGWNIFNLIGEIYSSVWNTQTFLYDIWELRCEQNNMGDQISDFKNNEQSESILKSDTATIHG